MKVVLVGFMGAGKTEVARILGMRLGIPVIDTDEMVCDWTQSTVQEIFASEGEASFRARERQVVRRTADLQEVVISAGGGSWLDEENRRHLSRGATVVHLSVSPGAVLERIDDVERPLLAGKGAAEVRRLMRERAPAYSLAAEEIDTTDLTPKEVAERVIRTCAPGQSCRSPAEPEELQVQVDDPYRIVVGEGMLKAPVSFLSGVLSGRNIAIISDELVWQLWGRAVRDDLDRAGYRTATYRFWGGEKCKDLQTVEEAADHLLCSGIDRHSTLLALGGGVPGDVGGFVAAVLLRGIPYVQIPTTLLAQVDSSVGGKVGVNHRLGKNLLGSFHQPRLVLSDVTALRTLPEREFLSGLGEVIKHGFLAGGDYLDLLCKRQDEILHRDPAVLREVVAGSCRIKEGFVRGDEKDQSQRMMLNFGHTLGHALETASGGRVAHGIAVACGMGAAARISGRLGVLPSEGVTELENVLRGFGLPRCLDDLSDPPDRERIMAEVRHDKKRRDGRMRWILLRSPGDPQLSEDVPAAVALENL